MGKKNGKPQASPTPVEVTPQQHQIMSAMYQQARTHLELLGVNGTDDAKHQAAFRAAQDFLGLRAVFDYLRMPCPRGAALRMSAFREPVLAGAKPTLVFELESDARGIDPSRYDLSTEADREALLGAHLVEGFMHSPGQRAVFYAQRIFFEFHLIPKQTTLTQDNTPAG